MYEVSALYSYAVKSFAGRSLSEMKLDAFGPCFDRRFMLIDQDGKHVTQRCTPQLANFDALVSGDALELAFRGHSYVVPLAQFKYPVATQVWSDQVEGFGLDEEPSALDSVLTECLGKSVRLVYMPPTSVRAIDPEFASHEGRVGYADAFPFLICNEASLDDLNSRLDTPVPMHRFRPNIVIKGAEAFAESEWRRIRIGSIEFDLVKPCSRCSMITLDGSGAFNKEPLKTLASYRLNEYGACFGENAMHGGGEGVLTVGAKVEVLE